MGSNSRSITFLYAQVAVKARVTEWQSVALRYEKAFEGASKAMLKHLILARLKAGVETWELAVGRESTAKQGMRREFHERYLAQLDAMAENPALVFPQRAVKLRAEEAAWLTEIAEGFTVSFCCRSLTCRFYGDNSEWIVEDTGGHFKCPVCLQLYQPFQAARKTASGVEIPLLPFQKVCRIMDLVGGSQPCVFAAKWPGGEADSWLLAQAEIRAAEIADPVDVQEYMQSAVQDLHVLIRQVGTPVGMTRFAWNAGHHWNLDARRWPRDGVTGWARLEANGFCGNILPEAEDYHPFEQWHELIGLLSRVLVSKRALANL